MTEAIGHLREAVRLDPRDADLRSNLAMALAHVGSGIEAGAEFEAATRLRQGNGVEPGRSAARLPPP
jgi:Flp pilus assembly protein TadD